MMTGAFADRCMGEVFPVVSAVAKLIRSLSLYDSNPAQRESLLSVNQSLRDVNNGIDDRD